MARIVVMNHVTLDGVMQSPGRPEEDTSGGFTQGGWAVADEAAGEIWARRMAAGGGLAGWLLGRRTYQDVLSYWTQRADRRFGDALVAAPKYVASTTLEDPPPWPNTSLLRGDVATAVGHLKADIDGVLAIMGSGQLIDTLLRHELIDEFLLMINPVVLGSGRRLFPHGCPALKFRCLESELTPGGLLVATYGRTTDDDQQ